MSSWDDDMASELERGGIPPLPASNASRQSSSLPSVTPSLSRLSSRQRRQQQPQPVIDRPSIDENVISIPSRLNNDQPQPYIPSSQHQLFRQQQQQQRQQQLDDDDDPFAPSRPSYPAQRAPAQPAPPSFVHPLSLGDTFRLPPTPLSTDRRDPHLQRIESTLLRLAPLPPAASASSSSPALQQLQLTRPVVPPLRLGEVIQRVLGAAPLTRPDNAPAAVAASLASSSSSVVSAAAASRRSARDLGSKDAQLKSLVKSMRLHASITPAARLATAAAHAASGVASGGLDPARAEYLGGEDTLDYDENDDDSHTADSHAASSIAIHHDGDGLAEESRPLSPRRLAHNPPLVIIEPDDLARRPEDLAVKRVMEREELMAFRRNAAAATTSIGNTPANGMGASRGRDLGSGLGATGSAAVVPASQPSSSSSVDTFVESKTTGEFLRVRNVPSLAEEAQAEEYARAGGNVHNLRDFDHAIDAIIDTVNDVQGGMSTVWLMMTGLLVGACLIQTYLIYLRSSDLNFLSYYSILAGSSRKVIYTLSGFSLTLSLWRLNLERYDSHRHAHFTARYHIPNNSHRAVIRTGVCALAYFLVFLFTLVMVPLDDYMDTQYQSDPLWYINIVGGLPSYYTSRIVNWYALAMARLIFVSIGWLCMIDRYGTAEFEYLHLSQIDYDKRNVKSARADLNTNGAMGIRIGQAKTTTMGHSQQQPMANRTSRAASVGEVEMMQSSSMRNSERGRNI